MTITDRCKKEFPKVHFVGSQVAHNQEQFKRDTVTIHWSQKLTLEIGGGHTTYLPTIVTQASYIISLASLKGHRYIGVTGCGKNHLGSISADGDTPGDVNIPKNAGVHPYITVHDIYIEGSATWSFIGRPMGTYNALVDIMGHKDLGEKSLLFLIDGLYGTPTEADAVGLNCKWLQNPFNNKWTSSMFMSLDDIALESVLVDFYRQEQYINPNVTEIYGSVDNVLHEAAQGDNPPSGTFYDPEADGIRLKSLGVHEHWNDPVDKQYSVNLGKGPGIELDEITPTLSAPSGLSTSLDENNNVLITWSNDGVNDGNLIIYKSKANSISFIPVKTIDGNSTSWKTNWIQQM